MPEEINRVITDHVSDYLMVSEPAGIRNLEKEGFDKAKYQMVGNIMIESLIHTEPKWKKINLPDEWKDFTNARPVVATFHRPENVDAVESLGRIVEIIELMAEKDKIFFPVHPRTKAKLREFCFLERLEKNRQILLTEPLGYFHFLKMISLAGLVVTDSGGVQEETSFLNIPCITFRRNTERPVTIEMGTNILMDILDTDFINRISSHKKEVIESSRNPIPYWDNEVSNRIYTFIEEHIRIS
jgi:UDP-N-acetylglucosamine 2-epimerase (non-hydrolysing)